MFDKHINCEFQEHNVDAIMKTMVREPYVHHVPVLTRGVYSFYKNHFVGKMPQDTTIKRISRTVSKELSKKEIRLLTEQKMSIMKLTTYYLELFFR
jgi:carboxymethylenebutenolidase